MICQIELLSQVSLFMWCLTLNDILLSINMHKNHHTAKNNSSSHLEATLSIFLWHNKRNQILLVGQLHHFLPAFDVLDKLATMLSLACISNSQTGPQRPPDSPHSLL